ncbi:broad-specificity cellobiase [Nocardiopsis sp. Huas11]|uniref:GH1 family beta-glucosidase n=1 Tax=Nocardiopsis sp. Huas11 TaxID=2183912 RepID=UPI000EAE9EE9|nr:GH1 family beta-glucosidase [Nocardiopsis sp. Huas11]RKS09934.1 broad-specificity cellobiase [Nocardiopsis sp. Huas11]
MSNSNEFPEDFLWGAATASFQIEGATTADGRGRSIWDTFCDTPGKVLGGDTGEPADDHYRRYADDVALMKRLNLGAYRFSIAWPRIVPDGSGEVNPAGLAFYDRLVDELLEQGLQPWATLYHWDLPQTLEDAGGWPARDTAYRFRDYAKVVADALGDRVEHWMTLNEPWCASFLGYYDGHHAPGHKDPEAALAATHHLLLGHGLATEAIRSTGRPAKIGMAHNQAVIRPHGPSAEDARAARRADGVRNRLFIDPVLHGRYPADVVQDLAAISDFSFVQDGDLETISVPIDFLGVNYYTPEWVAASAKGLDPDLVSGEGEAWLGAEPEEVHVSQGLPVTHMGWEIDPTGLFDVLQRLAGEGRGIDLYVTENGCAFEDTVSEDGAVHDPDRLAYYEGHLRAAREAIHAGIPLRGYFAWSLLDNFEWAWGYSRRFGLVHVDYDTQVRTVKDSGHWYAELARTGRFPDTTATPAGAGE